MSTYRTYSEKDVERVLYSPEQIQARVTELAAEISRDYASARRIFMLPILKGAGPLFNDLNRLIDPNIPRVQDSIILESYGKGTVSSGSVKTILDLKMDVSGEDILVVEDIVDSGRTLSHLINEILKPRNPKSIRLCVLLDKPSRRAPGKELFHADYTGFTIDDHFVVGYGMDYQEYLRNLPYVGILKPEVYR
ncbi:MAG: hypoxanthine phosphoribosyltransferase [Candidatus Woesearchaeota archaeon]